MLPSARKFLSLVFSKLSNSPRFSNVIKEGSLGVFVEILVDPTVDAADVSIADQGRMTKYLFYFILHANIFEQIQRITHTFIDVFPVFRVS